MIRSAIIPSASGNATLASIGGRARASLLTISYPGAAVMLVGMGSAGMLASWFSCHEMEDASCTAEENAMVLVTLPVLVVALGVLVNTKVVLAA